MKLENVLVVGGSGFIGRHLVAALAAQAIKVTVPSRHRERAKDLTVLPTVDVVETDVTEPGVLEKLLVRPVPTSHNAFEHGLSLILNGIRASLG